MSQSLPIDENKFDKKVILEYKLKNSDDNDINYFLEVDLSYLHNMREKTKYFPFAPEIKKIKPDNFTPYKNKNKPDSNEPHEKLIYVWTDRKKIFFHYRMLKIYVRNGMIVDKSRELISVKQNKWLEMYINLNTQKKSSKEGF